MTNEQRERLLDAIGTYASERESDGMHACCHPNTERAYAAITALLDEIQENT